MKKQLTLVGFGLLALFVCTGWITHVNNWWISSSQLTDCELSWPSSGYMTFSTGGYTLKSLDMGVGYVSATGMTITAPAIPLASVGLSGTPDAGSVEGSLSLGVSDSMAFCVPIPQTMAITGTAGDLMLFFDGVKPAAVPATDTCSVLRVQIYDGDSTTAIVTDLVTFDSGASRAHVGLTAYAGGLGALASITSNDRLYVVVTPVDVDDTATVYGVRLKYRAGMEVTE